MSARASVVEPVTAMPINVAWKARAQVYLFMFAFLDVLMCREQRHAFIRAALRPRSSKWRVDADQVKVRGGWSGGSPMRPSAIRSTSAKDGLWVWKEIWMPLAEDGSA